MIITCLPPPEAQRVLMLWKCKNCPWRPSVWDLSLHRGECRDWKLSHARLGGPPLGVQQPTGNKSFSMTASTSDSSGVLCILICCIFFWNRCNSAKKHRIVAEAAAASCLEFTFWKSTLFCWIFTLGALRTGRDSSAETAQAFFQAVSLFVTGLHGCLF